MNRRDFLWSVAAGASATALNRPGIGLGAEPARRSYDGPNVIIVRFGGGVRRRETIAADETYSPFLKKVLAPQGVLFPFLEIADAPNTTTSHGEGTLYILTGKYEKFKDIGDKFLGARFEAKVPTLFESFRKAYDVPADRALLVNGEDRIDEEFYTFSNHLGFGIDYRSMVLSLYRYKVHVLRRQLAGDRLTIHQRKAKLKRLFEMEGQDRRDPFRTVTIADKDTFAFHPDRIDLDPATTPELGRFWDTWTDYYGRSGLVNPRGDRLLTELTIRAMRELQPRLIMVNFNDPDYVHWGNPNFYTRGVAIVDEGLRQLYEAARGLDAYRDRTVFVVVPDCGRDSNPLMACPYQHHFGGTRSAHEIFALVVGPGIDRGRVVDKAAEQCSVARTVAGVMDFPMPFAEGPALEEVFA